MSAASLLGEVKLLTLRETPKIMADCPRVFVNYWRKQIATSPWYSHDREQFLVVLLNTRRFIIGHHLVGIGTMDTVLFHPREALRAAVIADAHAFIAMHNHPSGGPSPSDGDVSATRTVQCSAAILGIELRDQIIVADVPLHQRRSFVSLLESGHLKIPGQQGATQAAPRGQAEMRLSKPPTRRQSPCP